MFCASRCARAGTNGGKSPHDIGPIFRDWRRVPEPEAFGNGQRRRDDAHIPCPGALQCATAQFDASALLLKVCEEDSQNPNKRVRRSCVGSQDAPNIVDRWQLVVVRHRRYRIDLDAHRNAIASIMDQP